MTKPGMAKAGTASKDALVVIPTGRSTSNHAQVARAIGIDIVAGRYPEGGKLPGDLEFTEQFHISRPVLRESIKTLVAKGLLTTKTRVGTIVRRRAHWNMFDADVLAWHLDAGIGERFLHDLAEIRLAVEPRAAALAAERRTAEDVAALYAAIRRMEESPRESPGDTPAFADGDLSLHLAVANAAGNPFMRSIGAVIEAALRASFVLSAPRADQRDRSILLHRRIVEAIEARQPDTAAAAMSVVVLDGLQRWDAARHFKTKEAVP